jgi:inosine-uridine nucleoside N-ribohydrolase
VFKIVLAIALLASVQVLTAQDRSAAPDQLRQKVIIDTDIGDDVDDAFAVALALRSPELDILGITTTFGDTELRARILDRFLRETGHSGIAIAAGKRTDTSSALTQRAYAERNAPGVPHLDAVDFMLRRIQQNPGEITLIAIGPLVNIGALIDKDRAAFRKLRRVVLMGGSVAHGYGDLGYTKQRGPEPEWNIKNDVPAAQKLFASGVPIFMMPLDSTQLKLDEVKRAILFRAGTPLTDALTLLYHEWGQQTPTLFDAMAVAYAVVPDLCPTAAMHISVEADGMTRREHGEPNAAVCLNSDPETFFRFYIPRVIAR